MKSESSSKGIEPTYRSGTAARLAGIPVDTLRMWERRYNVVGPQVSERGHRRYAAEDVDRLAARAGLEFQRDVTMPANNQLLVWLR